MLSTIYIHNPLITWFVMNCICLLYFCLKGCHSATASGGLSSATMSPVGSASTPALSTPSATNRALVTSMHLT